MTTVRYARVQSAIADDNSDDNANQLQTIDSEEEDENVLPPVKVSLSKDGFNEAPSKRSQTNKNIVLTLILILCYFVLSIGLTFYQRWLLKVAHRNDNAAKGSN